MKRRRILFLQLPHLDNDVGGAFENVPLAGLYLRCALERSPEAALFEALPHDPGLDSLDDHRLLEACSAARPDVVVATLYLWNVERALSVLARIKALRPEVTILAGGPEVAPGHPFLFRAGALDGAVSGEGEQVFPILLRALRTGRDPDLAAVAWRGRGGWAWGKRVLPRAPLAELLPPGEHPGNRPDAQGVAYMETTRGCPLRCAFCCYNQRRPGVSWLPADDVERRVAILQQRGATEIRFVDPTFNSHPEFEEILRRLGRRRGVGGVRFFAELRADTVTAGQAALLAKANFRAVEIGVQSRDRAVLRRIRRPTDLGALDRGLRHLARRGIEATVDIMCALPGQGPADVRRSLKWAAGIPRARVQFLHTLAIPGTDLRARREEWGLACQPRPPYRVTATPRLSPQAIARADEYAERVTGRRADCPAQRFVGRSLPDLFAERVRVDVDRPVPAGAPAGSANRRAVLFEGGDLYGARRRIERVVRAAVRSEPHALWQFVLVPVREEPLDLIDGLAAVLDRFPPALLDRMSIRAGRAHTARRIFVQLKAGLRFDRGWIEACEALLRQLFG